jgi:hypothetical protein
MLFPKVICGQANDYEGNQRQIGGKRDEENGKTDQDITPRNQTRKICQEFFHPSRILFCY